ncbi:MAG TPA: hypothetical protein VGL03_15020 [Thermoanaerobaculia bacterium]
MEKTNAQESTFNVRSWVLLGLAVLGVIAVIAIMARRRKEESLSIYDRTASSPVGRVTLTRETSVETRPRSPLPHHP